MTDLGKLDALLIARTFGLTVHELMQALNDLALHLRDLFGSLETARTWLRAPNPVLNAQSPITYLLRGDTTAINRLLRMAETGIPT